MDKLCWLLFTDATAGAIMDAPGTTAPADDIDSFLGTSVRLHGLTTRTRLWEFWRDAASTGREPRAGMVRIQKTGLQMYGVMTFHGTYPEFQLVSGDAVYFNFIDGRIERLTMWIQDGTRAFEVQNAFATSKMSVSMQNGRPVLHVTLSTFAMLSQDESGGRQDVTAREMRRYEAVMASQLVRECTRVMKQFQQHRLDVYGFGQYAYTHQLLPLSQVERQWPDEFARAQVDIQANVALVQKGVIM